MITIKNKQRRHQIDSKYVQQIVQKLLSAVRYPDFDIGIIFVSSKAMRAYNKQYRHKDCATDVLSFPYYPHLKPRQRIKAKNPDEKNLGDIIICPEYVTKQLSEKEKRAIDMRIVVLIIHGLCHLLGYEHETTAQHTAMKRKELQLSKRVTLGLNFIGS